MVRETSQIGGSDHHSSKNEVLRRLGLGWGWGRESGSTALARHVVVSPLINSPIALASRPVDDAQYLCTRNIS